MTSCFVSRIRIHCKYSSQWWHRESSFNIVASFFNYCLRIGTKDSRWLFQLRQFSTNMSYSMAFPQFWVWNPRTILLINILNWLVPSHSSMDSWNLSICTWSIICRVQNTWPHNSTKRLLLRSLHTFLTLQIRLEIKSSHFSISCILLTSLIWISLICKYFSLCNNQNYGIIQAGIQWGYKCLHPDRD